MISPKRGPFASKTPFRECIFARLFIFFHLASKRRVFDAKLFIGF